MLAPARDVLSSRCFTRLPNARGVALDISPGAIEVATTKCRKAFSERSAQFSGFRLFRCEESNRNVFDLIVSNPPYVPADDLEGLQREVRDHEPHLALKAARTG